MKKTICGVDVSKAKLDVCIEPGHRLASFNNNTAGIAELAAFCREHAVTLLVMEASGGYERRAFIELWEKGISCALTNPRNVRRYGEAMGILEKPTGSILPSLPALPMPSSWPRCRCRARLSSA